MSSTPAIPTDSLHPRGGCSEHGSFAPDVILELEQAYGVALPADYLAYLHVHNGGQPVPAFFWVVPGDWGTEVEFLGAQRTVMHMSLLRNLDWVGLELKPGMLVIGEDGCFAYILMSTLAADFGSIHFCLTWPDHPDCYQGQRYWHIAGSFSEFLGQLQDPPP